ncbi:MAG: hypothetical protein IT260_14870 [Saprospiraceae bacterium]|nr:hypothetical protein [Saprospiraceae bacterium]
MPKKLKEVDKELHVNRVYQTLQCLEPAEIKRLLKYLKSPYFNQSKTLIALFQEILPFLESGQPGFDRHGVWQNLFPGAPFDDVNFRKYCSDLLKLVEGFMSQETIAMDPDRQVIDLLEFVVRRKVEPLYSVALRQARRGVDETKFRSLDDLKNTYRVERLYYEMMDFDVKLNTKSNLEQISINLDLFYWIEKLKLYASVLSQKRTGNFNYNLYFNEEIFEFLKNIPIDEIPELAIYYYSLLMLRDGENDDYYFKLKKLLTTYGPSMPQKEAIELYDSALHYCTGKLNQGNRDFMQEYFEMFEDGLTKGIFIVNNELATWRFNNAVAAALRLGKLEWAENFIENNKKSLPIDTQRNTYSFNLARVYRYQRKYDLVLSLLRNIEYEDIGYNLLSKSMLINAYYELKEFDALDSFMESFRVFLNRHKNIPLQWQKSYLNMLKYVRRLTRIAPGDKKAVEKLRQDIHRESSNNVNQKWLLEKLEELD